MNLISEANLFMREIYFLYSRKPFTYLDDNIRHILIVVINDKLMKKKIYCYEIVLYSCSDKISTT